MIIIEKVSEMSSRFSKGSVLKGLVFVALMAGQNALAKNALNDFFSRVDSYQADFTQTVSDEDGIELERGEGKFSLKRPGRFVWEYHEPLPQEIISNGKKIWLYDEDFEQVTVRDYDVAVNGTPAELLAGDSNIVDYYDIVSSDITLPNQTFELTPKDENSPFTQVNIEFEDGVLSSISLKDSFYRLTKLDFINRQENVSLKDSLFIFQIPDGVDVINERNE